MSRHFLVTFLICASLGSVRALGQSFKVENGVDGVRVSGPDSADFQALTSPVRIKMANQAAIEPLLPFSVAVTNTGAKAIAYYVIRYNRTNSAGKTLRTVIRVNHKARGMLAAGGAELAFPVAGLGVDDGSLPGSAANLASSRDRVLADFRQSPVVTATLDAVVFQDGELRGPDTTETLWLLNSKTDGVVGILTSIESSISAPGADVPKQLMAMLQVAAPFQPISEGTNPESPAGAAVSSEHAMAAGVLKASLYSAQQLILGSLLGTYKSGGPIAVLNEIADRRRLAQSERVWRNQ